jgi:hypothetical protein
VKAGEHPVGVASATILPLSVWENIDIHAGMYHSQERVELYLVQKRQFVPGTDNQIGGMKVFQRVG